MPHRHARTDEVHFVREGRVRYLRRGSLRTAYAGDVIVFRAGTLHAGTAGGNLNAITGPGRSRRTIGHRTFSGVQVQVHRIADPQ